MSGEQVRLQVPPKLYRVHSWITQIIRPEVEPGHRVNDFVWVGLGLGSRLFIYRPGIVTRFLREQQNDTAAVSMLGTHEWNT